MLDIQEIKDGVQLAAQEYPIKKAELFGSYANGTNRPDSDVDLLNHRDEIILEKVLSEANVAADMMKGCSLAEFLDNEMLKRAVCMTVINVGELVKNLTEDCRLSHPEVAWKNIAGFRDIAAHKYQTLRREDVYETTVTDFPDLQLKITKILAE